MWSVCYRWFSAFNCRQGPSWACWFLQSTWSFPESAQNCPFNPGPIIRIAGMHPSNFLLRCFGYWMCAICRKIKGKTWFISFFFWWSRSTLGYQSCSVDFKMARKVLDMLRGHTICLEVYSLVIWTLGIIELRCCKWLQHSGRRANWVMRTITVRWILFRIWVSVKFNCRVIRTHKFICLNFLFMQEATRLSLVSGDQASYARSIRIMGDIYRKKAEINVRNWKHQIFFFRGDFNFPFFPCK